MDRTFFMMDPVTRPRIVLAAAVVALAAAFWLGRDPLSTAFYERGIEAKDEWRSDDARRLLGLASRLGREDARLELARSLEKGGDVPGARRLLDELLASATDDPRLEARILAADAHNLYLSRQPDAALERYGQALEAARHLGDTGLEGRLLMYSATVYYVYVGDLDEARVRLERALALSRESSNEALEADVLSSLGRFYWWYQRQRERPLPEFYTPALAIYERLGDRKGIADSRSRIGLVHLANLDYEDCARELEASRAGYEALGDRRGLGNVHSFLGALYAGLENYPQAHEHYQKSLGIAEATGDSAARRRLEPLLVDLELRHGEYQRAVELYDRMITEAPDPSVELRNHLTGRGHALLQLDRTADALASYLRAYDVYQATDGADESFRSRILTGLSHAHRRSGDLEAAERALAEAEAIPIETKGWDETVLTLLARADLADRRDEKEAALGYLLAAAEIESRTLGTARSHFFQTQYRQVFDRIFSLLFADVVVKDRAEQLVFRLLEQMRYRSFRSVLVRLVDAPPGVRPPGAGELDAVRRIEELTRRLDRRWTEESWEALRAAYARYEDRVLRSELAATHYRLAAEARPVELATLRQRLPADTVLVEYVLAGEKTFALVVSRHDVDSVVLPVETSRLASKVKLFRDRIFDASESDWQTLAAELGRLVVEPIEHSHALGGARHLTIVPMGFLHGLPFAALGGADTRPLIERYTLSLASSATLWSRQSTWSRQRWASDTPGVKRNGAVAFGLNRATVPELEPLAFAEQEAAAVAGALGGEARLGAEATEAAFKALAPSTRLVHVAAHAVLEKRIPLHSRLQLEPDGEDDGKLTVREILDLGLDAELVTLSACDTAWSRSPGLEVDRLGLVEAFLHAGAENVMASLLPVSDGASAAFMTAFYARLVSMAPAEALAATQREMVASNLAHPRYWASFVLVGRR